MPRFQAESTARQRPTLPTIVLILGTALMWLFATGRAESESTYQGFGATTPGGDTSGTVVHVTNLNDSGPGSLREAVSKGNRTVVFDVSGDIVLNGYLYVRGAFITIDGFTAPPPGITLRNRGLVIRGSRGAHDVIVRGIRVRKSPADGISVSGGAYNVVIDHVSVHGSGDGNLDITENSRDVTVSWSIFAEPTSGKNMLIKYNPSRVTLHHNLFVRGSSRNPQVRIDDAGTLAKDTTLDMRNNLVWDWNGYGTLVWYGPRANVVANYYATSGRNGDDALTVDADTARAYVAGNVSEENVDLDASSTEATPFAAPAVDTEDACTAAGLVVMGAGARPLDAVDVGYLADIALPECAGEIPPPDGTPPPDEEPPSPPPADSTRPSVSLGAPANGATLGGVVPVSAVASDNVGVLGVQFLLDGAPVGSEDVTLPYSISWDSRTATNGLHRLTARARDAGGNVRVSDPVDVTVANGEGSVSVELRIAASTDDASESASGTVKLGESSIYVGKNYLLGLRFQTVPIPQGARIESAVLRLHAQGGPTNAITIRYVGERAGDSAPFAVVLGNLSSRARSTAAVVTTPAPWTYNGFNASPDLHAIVQEIVNHPDWQSRNSLSLFVENGGSAANRMVGTFESSPSPLESATLTVTYRPF